MFSARDAQCLAILQGAVTSPFGIVLHTTNPLRARQELYRVRKSFGEPSMADIQIRASPDDAGHELWLIRPSVANTPTLSIGAVDV